MQKNNDNSRIVLGTAQIGLNYGIANISGKPNFTEAKNILNCAWINGIIEFDTAQGYGDSEIILGQIFESFGISSDVKVITKINTTLNHFDYHAIKDSLEHSIKNLKCKSLYGLMIHQENLLDSWCKGIGKVLTKFIEQKLVSYIGVSVYSTEKAIQALKIKDITIVQIPANILDRRFEIAGVFDLADKLEKTLYLRSVFLQGLLLMNPDKLPSHMKFAKFVLKELYNLTVKTGLTQQELALGYIKMAYPKTKVIIGSETSRQVESNIKTWDKPFPVELINTIRNTFLRLDEKILNPSLW